jgi:hypothetical protein
MSTVVNGCLCRFARDQVAAAVPLAADCLHSLVREALLFGLNLYAENGVTIDLASMFNRTRQGQVPRHDSCSARKSGTAARTMT